MNTKEILYLQNKRTNCDLTMKGIYTVPLHQKLQNLQITLEYNIKTIFYLATKSIG